MKVGCHLYCEPTTITKVTTAEMSTLRRATFVALNQRKAAAAALTDDTGSTAGFYYHLFMVTYCGGI